MDPYIPRAGDVLRLPNEPGLSLVVTKVTDKDISWTGYEDSIWVCSSRMRLDRFLSEMADLKPNVERKQEQAA